MVFVVDIFLNDTKFRNRTLDIAACKQTAVLRGGKASWDTLYKALKKKK